MSERTWIFSSSLQNEQGSHKKDRKNLQQADARTRLRGWRHGQSPEAPRVPGGPCPFFGAGLQRSGLRGGNSDFRFQKPFFSIGGGGGGGWGRGEGCMWSFGGERGIPKIGCRCCSDCSFLKVNHSASALRPSASPSAALHKGFSLKVCVPVFKVTLQDSSLWDSEFATTNCLCGL